MDDFFKDGDPFLHECVYPLETFEWWSRIYEYRFVADRVSKTDILLDEACGLGHPFKVFMVNNCKKIYACDINTLTINSIQEDRANWFPNQIPYDVDLLNKIDLKQADIANLPYEDDMFNKICCISVLEHVDSSTRFKALQEAYRCLKIGGKFLITVDYPDVDLLEMYSMIDSVGFKYKRKEKLLPDESAIKSVYHGNIMCYHFELTK